MKDEPLARFRLSLLARFELSGPDGPIGLPNKKLAGLLAFLVCTAPVPQPREKLTNLLWGSHFETQARQNLRQALFRLRRVLGQDSLIGDGEEIRLAPGIVDCDAVRLEALIREGSPASLAEVVNLYKGRFVADVAISEEAWDDWADGERQRLEGMALDALVRFGEIELAEGRGDKALETAHRALAINDLREDAHRLTGTGQGPRLGKGSSRLHLRHPRLQSRANTQTFGRIMSKPKPKRTSKKQNVAGAACSDLSQTFNSALHAAKHPARRQNVRFSAAS